MLALIGLAPRLGERTLAFDEIDAGIGGNTARAVGERLRGLGAERQVICITHLPQVASLAEAHFRIAKRSDHGRALATVARVDGDELVAEIVRMLGASRDDEVASRHARELLAAGAVSLNGEIRRDEQLTADDRLFGRYLLLRRGKKQYRLVVWRD